MKLNLKKLTLGLVIILISNGFNTVFGMLAPVAQRAARAVEAARAAETARVQRPVVTPTRPATLTTPSMMPLRTTPRAITTSPETQFRPWITQRFYGTQAPSSADATSTQSISETPAVTSEQIQQIPKTRQALIEFAREYSQRQQANEKIQQLQQQAIPVSGGFFSGLKYAAAALAAGIMTLFVSSAPEKQKEEQIIEEIKRRKTEERATREEELQRAIAEKDVKKVRELLKQGASTNVNFQKEFMDALESGNKENAKFYGSFVPDRFLSNLAATLWQNIKQKSIANQDFNQEGNKLEILLSLEKKPLDERDPFSLTNWVRATLLSYSNELRALNLTLEMVNLTGEDIIKIKQNLPTNKFIKLLIERGGSNIISLPALINSYKNLKDQAMVDYLNSPENLKRFGLTEQDLKAALELYF